ncbi:MAG: VWA domain-containing protein, partial [Roseiflexaceae bacterium]|nr:VWA domain-containing protein [Roseiflexaceae bacterium]
QLVADQAVQLQPGPNIFSVPITSGEPGVRRYRAEINAPSDAQPRNNTAEALIQVAGPPRILIVEGTAGEGAPLRDALAAAQVTADLVEVAAMPAGLGELAVYESLVLVNVAASALPPGANDALPAYVRDLGRGLVMIGGTSSYGAGGYLGTPLAEVLPVALESTEQIEQPKVAIVFVLDTSRSMQNCHCNGPNRDTDTDRSYFETGRMKIDIAKDGVLQSIATLTPRDDVAVVTFDTAASVPFPLQTEVTQEKILQAIGGIPAHGLGTNIGSGLQGALDVLRTSDAAIKHAVIVTDGWGESIDPLQIAATMRAEGMTLSVVGDGPGASPALQELAEVGGGRYFPVNNPEEIPTIFVNATRRMLGSAIIEEPFTPAYAAQSPVLNGLEGGLPQLYGHNLTSPKTTATVALEGLNSAPLLAHWQYGLGRVAAWTSDTKGQWARDFIAWPGFPQFAAQLIGFVAPAAATGTIDTRVQTVDGALAITAQLPPEADQPGARVIATLLAADGTRQEFILERSGVGVYTASAPLPAQGGYLVNVASSTGGQPQAQGAASLVVPYSAEYGLSQRDPALLASLAAKTGGAQLNTPTEAFAHTRSGATRPTEISIPLLLLALILLPLDILLRRRTGRRTGRS